VLVGALDLHVGGEATEAIAHHHERVGGVERLHRGAVPDRVPLRDEGELHPAIRGVRVGDVLVEARVRKRRAHLHRLRRDRIVEPTHADAKIGEADPEVLDLELDRLEVVGVAAEGDRRFVRPAPVADSTGDGQRAGAGRHPHAALDADPVDGQDAARVLAAQGPRPRDRQVEPRAVVEGGVPVTDVGVGSTADDVEALALPAEVEALESHVLLVVLAGVERHLGGAEQRLAELPVDEEREGAERERGAVVAGRRGLARHRHVAKSVEGEVERGRVERGVGEGLDVLGGEREGLRVGGRRVGVGVGAGDVVTVGGGPGGVGRGGGAIAGLPIVRVSSVAGPAGLLGIVAPVRLVRLVGLAALVGVAVRSFVGRGWLARRGRRGRGGADRARRAGHEERGRESTETHHDQPPGSGKRDRYWNENG